MIKLLLIPGANCVFILNDQEEVIKVLGEPGPAKSDPGVFYDPAGAVFLPDGRLLVADSWNHRIQTFGNGFEGIVDLTVKEGVSDVKRIAGLNLAESGGVLFLAVFHYQPVPAVTIFKMNP